MKFWEALKSLITDLADVVRRLIEGAN